MSDAVEFRGQWWLPGEAENAIAGTLIFDAVAGLTLKAVGLFRDPFPTQALSEVHPIIHGRTTNSEDITLCRCLETRSNCGTGVSTSELSVSVALIDAHVASFEDLRFVRAYAAYAHLPRWAGLAALTRRFTLSDGGRGIAHVAHEFAFPPEHPVRIDDWELRFVVSAQTNLDRYERATIETTTSVQVEFYNARSFAELINGTLRHIQDFLSLAVGQACSLLQLKVVRAGKDPKREAIRVLYAQGRKAGSDKLIEPETMIFTFEEVRDVWPAPLRHYLDAKDHIRSAMDLHSAVANSPAMLLEVQFLNLAQALESFHRGIYDATVLSPDQFALVRERIEQLLQSPQLGLPREARASLFQKVEYWNEVSLRKRMRDLIAGLRPDARAVIGAPSRFVSNVVDARNYLTHRDPKLQSSVSDLPALIRLTHQLKFLVEYVLLQAVGVPDKILDRHAKRTATAMQRSTIIA